MKVSKTILKLGLSVLICLIFGCFIYFTYGTPWDRVIYKKHFSKHLEDKYEQEFKVKKLSFDFFHSRTYHAYAYPKGDSELTIYVGQNPETKAIEDGYYTEVWQLQAEQKLTPIIEKYYDDNFKHLVTIHPIPSSFSENSIVPPFQEYTTVDIGVSLDDYEITEENRESEVHRAYLLLEELKETGIQFEHLGMSYKNKTLQLQPGDIDVIKIPEDIDRFLNDYRK